MPLSRKKEKIKNIMMPQLLSVTVVVLALACAVAFWSNVGIELCLLLLLVLLLCLLLSNRKLNMHLAAKQHEYEALLCNITGGLMVSVCDPNPDKMLVLYASEGFSVLTGYTIDDIDKMYGGRYINIVYPEDRDKVIGGQPKADELDREYSVEYRIVRRNGEVVWVLDRGRYLTDSKGVRQAQGVLTDITEIRRAQDELSHNEELLRITFACTDNAIFEYDYNSRMYTQFMNSETLLGKTCQQINQELAGIHRLEVSRANDIIARHFCYRDDVAKYLVVIQQVMEKGEATCITRLNTSYGDYVWCKVHLLSVCGDNGEVARVVGFINNVDDLKRQSDSFKRRSEKDALTGFYNKPTTVTLINEVLSRSFEDSNVLFVLDIDNFKAINDTLGHNVGDAVIAEAAERIRGVFRSDDILGRIGGDEFTVLARGLSGDENIIRKSRDIVEAFRIMSVNAGGVLNISVSIGIELPPACPSSYEELFPNADKALYEAKRRGKGCYVFYNTSMQGEADVAPV